MDFKSLAQENEFIGLVEAGFRNIIEPKYGPQKRALAKIIDGKDRKCEILIVDDEPKGLLIFKTELQNEFNLQDALELKTLFLFDPAKDKGNGKFLFQRLYENAVKLGAKYVYSTIFKEDDTALGYFEKIGWKRLPAIKTDDNKVIVYPVYKIL